MTYGSMIVGILLGGFLSYYVIKVNVTYPLKKVEEHIEQLAQGNFSIEIPKDIRRKKDEFRSIAKAFNHMQSSVTEIVEIVAKQSSEMGLSAMNLSKTSEDMSTSSQDLSTTMQQVAEGAVNQSQYLQNILEALESLNDNILVATERLGQVSTESEQAERRAETGKQEMDSMVNSVNEVRNSFSQVIDMIDNLSNSISEISGITNIISGISQQTNLLALNAAIEAARAGHQVKSTSKIVDDNISKQVESISSTASTFEDILISIEAMLPMIQDVNHSMESIQIAKNTVADKAADANTITVENSAATEEAAASSEELSASSQEVASTAHMLESIVDDLKVAVQRFEV